MARYETSEPLDIADRLLWRDAQRLVSRHTEPDRDGRCVWCGGEWPCPPRRLAERAEIAARRHWHEPWPAADAGSGGSSGGYAWTGDRPYPDTSRWADLVDYASHPR